jgi:hypothetical protein
MRAKAQRTLEERERLRKIKRDEKRTTGDWGGSARDRRKQRRARGPGQAGVQAETGMVA